MYNIQAYLPSKVHQNAMNNVRVAAAKNIRNERVNTTFISIFTGIYGCAGRVAELGTCLLGSVAKVAVFSIRLISKDFLTERFDRLPGWEALRKACLKTIQQAAAVLVSVVCAIGEFKTLEIDQNNATWAYCNYNIQLKWGLIQNENPVIKQFEYEKEIYENDLAVGVHDNISLESFDRSDDEFDADSEQDENGSKIQDAEGPSKVNSADVFENETFYTTAGAS